MAPMKSPSWKGMRPIPSNVIVIAIHPSPKRQHHHMNLVPGGGRAPDDAEYELQREDWCTTGFGHTCLPGAAARSETDTETTGGT